MESNIAGDNIKIVTEHESYHLYIGGTDCWIGKRGLHRLAEAICKTITSESKKGAGHEISC